MDMKDLIAWWPLNNGSGTSAVDLVSGKSDPIAYVFNHARFKPSSEPLWQKQGLLFDGYSTWITRSGHEVTQPSSAFTIAVWVAPRAFDGGLDGRLSAVINQHNREAKQGYVLGIYRSGRVGLQLGISDEWVEAWADVPVPKGKWSHLAAAFDGQLGLIHLYLNGKRVGEKVTPKGTLNPCNTDLLIGRNNQAARINKVFYGNMFNGIISDLRIYSRAFSDDEVSDIYRASAQLFPLSNEVFLLDRAVYNGDRHRPQYHLIAPGHWMNEPHAPIYFKGKYHIFYQHNPHGPYWQYIHWGHLVSDDMVHWRDMPAALVPEDGAVDPDGCWSGSAVIDDDGIPTIFYTAGDESCFPNQRTAIAKSTYADDGDLLLTKWRKHSQPVTIQQPGHSELGNFRDPFVWKDGNVWYQLVGAGFKKQGGTALVYTSLDMYNWEYQGPLYVSDYDKYPYLGTMWELPVLLPLGRNSANEQKHILLVLPWGPGSSIDVFYWIGRWDKSACRFYPDDEAPRLIDLGDNHFTGPSGFVTPDGRTVLFSITQGKRSPQDEYDAGWAHNGGLPLELSLRADNRLGIRPIRELESLREEQLLCVQNEDLGEVNKKLASISGDMLEVIVEFEAESAKNYGIIVRQTPDRQEETRLHYDAAGGKFAIDRTKTSLEPDVLCKGVQGGAVDLAGENPRFHLFLDKSMLEVYLNGLYSLTSRVYPSRQDAQGLELWADGAVLIRDIRIWRMRSAY